MIVISFFILVSGLTLYAYLKHDDKITKTQLQKSVQEISNNEKWFESRYVADKSLEFDVCDKVKSFFHNKYLIDQKHQNIELDKEIDGYYKTTEHIYPRERDIENYKSFEEPKPLVDVILSKRYGKIRKQREQYGFKSDEYELANWIRNNFNDKDPPVLYGARNDNGFFYYCWEYSKGFYDYNKYGYDRSPITIERV